MKRLTLALAGIALSAAASAQPAALPGSGTVKHAAYVVCRSAATVDLGLFGSNAAADCRGIVKAAGAPKPFDNLALHCLEESVARKPGYKFMGTCVETNNEGDSLYLNYEGPENGPVELIGGTGRFKGIKGKGQWRVTDAPGNNATLFAFTLDYDFNWSME